MRFHKSILTLALAVTSGALIAQADTTKKAEFKPSGKVYGYAFGDYYYKAHADSALRGNSQYSGQTETTNAFEFRRVYLGFEYNITEKFTSDVLLSYEGNTLSDNATRTVFLKAANVRWKNALKRTDVIFGLQATPAFPMISEKIWGYRSIEKTVLDMRKGAGSADLGIGINSKLDEKGNYGFNLLVANGSGTKIETDIFKKFYGEFYAKFLDQHLVFDVYGDYERTGLAPHFHRFRSTYKVGAFYTTDGFTVGAEAYETIQHNYVIWMDSLNATPDTSDSKVMGVSAFVRGTVIKGKLSFFARYDIYTPDLNYNTNEIYTAGEAPVSENFITAGFDYTPVSNVHIMPNVWYNGYHSHAKNVTGKIKSDFDLVPRLTFWYVFK
jgi:hypothetical protein